MRPATVDAADIIKRDPCEARAIRASFDPTSRTKSKLDSYMVVDRVTVQTWRTSAGVEQKLVTYHVSKELEYPTDAEIDAQYCTKEPPLRVAV